MKYTVRQTLPTDLEEKEKQNGNRKESKISRRREWLIKLPFFSCDSVEPQVLHDKQEGARFYSVYFLGSGAGLLHAGSVGTARVWLGGFTTALLLCRMHKNAASASALVLLISGWGWGWLKEWVGAPLEEPTQLLPPFWSVGWDWWHNCYYYRKICGLCFCFKNSYLRYLWDVWMANR